LIGAVEIFATQTDALEERTVTATTAMTAMEEMMMHNRTMETSTPWIALISPNAKRIKIFGYGT
jgi:hypothetical protein